MHDSTNKILLLGNGFDIAHKFPTRYIDFLNIFQALNKQYSNVILNEEPTIGSLFSETLKKENNEFIMQCYTSHKEAYDNIDISLSHLSNIVDFTNNNYWFKYFSSCYNKEANWIDFEKEIGKVVNAFETVFIHNRNPNNGEYTLRKNGLNNNQKNIIEHFPFFYKNQSKDGFESFIEKILLTEYTIKNVYDNNSYIMNVNKIINDLYRLLKEFEKMFSLYILYFVDKVIDYEIYHKIEKQNLIFDIDKSHFDVVSFNYTSVYEKMYGNEFETISYIHGNQKEHNTILGIHPSEEKDITQIDTTFIEFKKYYQRIKRNTDLKYLDIIKTLKEHENKKFHLLVIGHSLDITDSDIIKFLMDNVDYITVFYHNDQSFGDYIKNIVKLYKKDKMDEMRLSGKLVFLPLETLYMK